MFNPNLGRTATGTQSINPMLGTLGGTAGALGMARSFGLLGKDGGNPFDSSTNGSLSIEDASPLTPAGGWFRSR
jgi:hypothetical protein